MKIKDRYIAKTLLNYSLVVMLIWLSIYSFFNFLSELNSVGTYNYTLLDAFKYTILQSPEVAYEQASAVILLGCVLGMGHLATTGQLIIFQVSGTSIFKITWMVIKNAMVFILLLILVGEFFAPGLTNYAKNLKSFAMGQDTLVTNQDGFWIRDGNNFIRVDNNIDGRLFRGVTVMELNSSNMIDRVIKSDNAEFDNNFLKMQDASIFVIDNNANFENITLKKRNSYSKKVSFDNDLINSLKKDPKDLTTIAIIKRVQFLTDNKLKSVVFEVELFNRLVKPLTLIAMILTAMLFIFGSTRDVTLGKKIFFGAALGLSFELVSRVGGAISLSYNFSPLISSFLPSIIVIIVSFSLLLKKSTNYLNAKT